MDAASGRKRSFGATISIVLIVVAAALVAKSGFGDRLLSHVTPRTYAEDLAAVGKCAGQRDVISCSRPYVKEMLAAKPATTTVQDIVDLKLPKNECHYVVHLVGQEVYKKYKNVEQAYQQCSRLCNSGCAHGVIAEAFTEELGLSAPDDAGHVSAQEIRDVGGKLCTNGSACHGVGHALVMASASLDEAVKSCDTIATGRFQQDCYRGIYMEYSDEVASRSILTDGSAPPLPALSSLAGLCTSVSKNASAACFYYFPLVVRETYRSNGINDSRQDSLIRVREMCVAMKDSQQRHDCLFGYGATQYDTLNDSQRAVSVCSGFPNGDDRRWCAAGMFSLGIEYELNDQSLAYCAALPASERPACYRTVFEKIDSVSRPVDPVAERCFASEPSCSAAAALARKHELHEYYW